MIYYCRLCNNNCQFTKEEMIEYDLLDEDLDCIINCFCPYMREFTDFVQDTEEDVE